MTVKKVTLAGATVERPDTISAVQRILGIHTSPEKVHDLECLIEAFSPGSRP